MEPPHTELEIQRGNTTDNLEYESTANKHWGVDSENIGYTWHWTLPDFLFLFKNCKIKPIETKAPRNKF